MTEQQMTELEKLLANFALVCIVVFDSDGKRLYQVGTPTTPWCQRVVNCELASDADAARTFRHWGSLRLPAVGGAGDEGCTFYLPQQTVMVAAFWAGGDITERHRTSGALAKCIIDILGAQQCAAPSGGPATCSGDSGVTEGRHR
jgi:hypothetical protein